jgi:hypothetical protein
MMTQACAITGRITEVKCGKSRKMGSIRSNSGGYPGMGIHIFYMDI